VRAFVADLPAVGGSSFLQMAWSVADLDAAVATWVQTMGAGPFFVRRHLDMSRVSYRGRPCSADWSIALGQLGSVQIELVHEHSCGAGSPVHDHLADGDHGLLHVARFVEDPDEIAIDFAVQGCETVQVSYDSLRRSSAVWIDTRVLLGTMVELFREDPARRARYREIADAAEGWDGRDPLREAR
jgi:hypothetical protein